MRACGAGIGTIYACVESVWARFQHGKGGRKKEEENGFLSILFFI
jgi:hypothetical protein